MRSGKFLVGSPVEIWLVVLHRTWEFTLSLAYLILPFVVI